MLNANTIWSTFHYVELSILENLLSKDALTIEDILDGEDILIELKKNSDLFGKFIRNKPSFIKSLLDYSIQEPIYDQNKGFKYPFISSEILCLDNQDLISCFFEIYEGSNDKKGEKDQEMIKGTKLLEYFLNFIMDNEFNSTTAGYIQKILNSILNLRGVDFLNHIFANDLQNILIKHQGHSAFSNFILRILKLDIPIIENNLFLFVDERIEIIRTLLQSYLDSHEEFIKENLSDIFIDILENYHKINAGNKLIEIFSENDNLAIFFNDFKSNNTIGNSYSANVAMKIILTFNAKAQVNKCLNDESPLGIKGLLNDYQRVLAYLFKDLPFILTMVTNEKFTKEITLNCGSVLPFGGTRLILMEILLICFKNIKDHKIINQLLIVENFLDKILRLGDVYRYNSFLHQIIQNIFMTIFIDDFYQNYINESLFEDSRMLYFIIEKFTLEIEEKAKANKKYHVSNPFLSHMYMILTYIENAAEKNNNLRRYLDKIVQWKNFKESNYKILKDKNNKILGDHHPKQRKELIFKSSFQDEEDEDNLDSKGSGAFEKIYEKYASYFNQAPQIHNRVSLYDDEDDDDDENGETNLFSHFDYCYDEPVKRFNDIKENEILCNAKVKEHEEKITENRKKSNDEKNIQNNLQKNDGEDKNQEFEYENHNFWKFSLNFDVDEIIKDL